MSIDKKKNKREDEPRKKKQERIDPKDDSRRAERKKTDTADKKPEKDGAAPRKRKKSGRTREYLVITYCFLFLFCAMIGYLVWFQMYKSDSFISSSYNPRLNLYEKYVVRGDIVSADGEVLATTEISEDGSEERVYPYGRIFAHVVGYTNNGKGGLESQYNFNLLRSHSFFLSTIINDLMGKKSQGDQVVTTLDTQVQQAAYEALGSNDGAVVVLEVSTGKVLAMVSKPDFDPNTLEEEWDTIVEDEESSVLLNRVTNGVYPPGSVFKIFTTLEYMREHPTDYDSYSYTCQGTMTRGENTIHCYNSIVHGEESLVDSFANSCNTSYATLGLTLNISDFQDLCDDMLFNTKLPGTISAKTSSFTLEENASEGLVMQTVIGQGNTMVTPLHMALVAQTIANDGVTMKPYLVEQVTNTNNVSVKKYESEEYKQLMSSAEAAQLQSYMEAVTAYGTGSALSGQSYEAAGKTGSAEFNSEGDSHAWFVGYGSKEGYEDIAIAVIVENGGSGSHSAVPVAKQVFDIYFNK